MIQEFLKNFADVKIENIHKIGKSFYQQAPQIANLVENMDEYPIGAGLFLGEVQKNKFVPSPNILNLISNQSSKHIILNEKSAWLFVCGRDIFMEGVVENCFERGEVLVLNEQHEVLGTAIKDGKTYKNTYDIGQLLRREQKKKRK